MPLNLRVQVVSWRHPQVSWVSDAEKKRVREVLHVWANDFFMQYPAGILTATPEREQQIRRDRLIVDDQTHVRMVRSGCRITFKVHGYRAESEHEAQGLVLINLIRVESPKEVEQNTIEPGRE